MRVDNPSFLVVEKDPALRRKLVLLLQQQGYLAIIEAETGIEAWTKLKSLGADMVITGDDMPQMTGLALVKAMRTDIDLANIPAIMVVSKITKLAVIQAGEAGVNDILLHPFTTESFNDKIHHNLYPEADPAEAKVQDALRQGLRLMEEGRFNEALQTFEQVLVVQESAEVYYNMGYIKTVQGRFAEALNFFRRATQINSAFATAFRKMGECYVKLGNKSEAQKSFEQAAEIFLDRQMDEDAESLLHEILELSPDTVNVFNSLGIIYRRQGRHEKALDQYQRALKINPNDEHIYFNMSRAYLELKQPQQARQCLQKALKINPQSEDAKKLKERLDRGRLDLG